MERLHLIDLAPRDCALGQVGADATVVHDGHVGAAGGALRIRNEPAEAVLVADPLQRELEPRDRPLRDVANRLLLAAEGFRQRHIGSDLVGIRGDELRAHLAPAADAHEVDDADRAGTRLRLHDGDAVDHGVHPHVRVTGDDQIDRSGIQLPGHVENLAVTGSGVPRSGTRVTECAHVRHDDHEVCGRPRLREIALDRLSAVTEREALDVARGGARRRFGRRQPDYGDLHAVLRNQRPRFRPIRPRGSRRVGDVRREERVFRFAHACPQRVHRPVELMIADRRRVDAERVHRVDRPAPERGIREQGSLHFVAGVEPH